MTGIFGLVGKLVKKKWGKPEAVDVHDQYMTLKLQVEEMALGEGIRFKELYLMGDVDAYKLLGFERSQQLKTLREQMSKLYTQLQPHEQAHHALDRGDEDLF